MAGALLLLAGCAKHADFVELRDHLATVSKSQEQDQKRLDALQRRLESLERRKDSESVRPKLDPKFDELSARIQKLESRLAKPDETLGIPVVPKFEPSQVDPARSLQTTEAGSLCRCADDDTRRSLQLLRRRHSIWHTTTISTGNTILPWRAFSDL